MKNILILFFLFSLMSGCISKSNHRSLSWTIPMNNNINHERIKYKDNVLTIDSRKVILPTGKMLFVKYKTTNGKKSTIVKVDGELIPIVFDNE